MALTAGIRRALIVALSVPYRKRSPSTQPARRTGRELAPNRRRHPDSLDY
jgi:hypothetical protein